MGQNIHSISAFFDGYRTIAQRLPAPTFNIFRILNKIVWWENITHTPLLAELLNPRGTHGQASLFLESFLRLPQIGLDSAQINGVGWTVDAQKAAKQGIPDLTIKNHSTKHIIMIENKILSDDHAGQLEGYFHSLTSDAHFTEGERRRLIYLTPDGREPEYFPITDPCFRCMSYRNDVKTWLQTLLSDISIPEVRECLTQYIQIIPNLRKGFVSMPGLDKEILDYLAEPENHQIAFEI